MPDFSREATLLGEGAARIAGIDEVGRGPLAGPVTAAAVVLHPARIPRGIDDSKVLDRGAREALAAEIMASAEVAVVHVSVEEIDRLNILHAALLAMRQAVGLLGLPPCHALVDGNRCPDDLPCPATPVIGGDGLCLSIAAASIVAKVARDRVMVELAQQHPGYGWETNAGYATKMHLSALQDLGPTPHHRRTFAPVRNILWQGESPSH